MEKPFKVTSSNRSSTHAIRIYCFLEEFSVALHELGLHRSRPILVLAGGAGELSDTEATLPRSLFVKALAPLVEALGNSGENTWKDVSQSVQAGRQAITVAGSGRAAHTLADALRGEMANGRASVLAASGLVQEVDLTSSSTVLVKAIERILSTKD